MNVFKCLFQPKVDMYMIKILVPDIYYINDVYQNKYIELLRATQFKIQHKF